jgi:transcriptional regulator with XRE-family HTH domain
MNKVYNNIYELRKAKGLSQMDLADKLNINQDSVSKLERGKIQLTIERLELLAEIFGMTVLEIMQYGGEAVQQPQIIDNEKVKELENKVLLLEKDLEIWKNRYELKINAIKNGFIEILSLQNFIQEVSKYVFKNHFKEIIKENITNRIKLVEELNNCPTNIFLIQLNYALEDVKNDIEISHNYDEIIIVYKMLNKKERDDILLKALKNLYISISINFEWSKEHYNQAIEECKLLGYDFTNTVDNTHHFTFRFDDSEEAYIMYNEKIRPQELLNWIQVKNLKEYKENPLYKQTGFFRIDNL